MKCLSSFHILFESHASKLASPIDIQKRYTDSTNDAQRERQRIAGMMVSSWDRDIH
jgi:hypothetical protein